MDDIVRPVKCHLMLFEKAYDGQFLDGAISDAGFFRADQAKRLRPILFFLSQGLVGKPKTRSVPLAVLIELLHTASLIHDDVVDGAEKRRGMRSYFARKGSRLSVLTGDYLLAKALAIGVSVSQEDILRIVSQVILSMTRGELLQNTLENSENMNAALYYQIIHEKTAALFAAACELAGTVQRVSSLQRNRLKQLGDAFGMGFQIRDDILDFTGSHQRLGKPTGLDIRNGQRTLPVLFALEKVARKEKITVLKKIANPNAVNGRWIVRFVEERNGVGRAMAEADGWTDRARSILFRFPPSTFRRALERLLEYDRERAK